MVKCKRRDQCLNSIRLVIFYVWAVVCISIVEGTAPLSAHCQYRAGGQGSVLVVTVHNPLPTAWGYYVLVERLDDPNVFFEGSSFVQRANGTMVFEVYGIPADPSHAYKVLVRPHSKNYNHWLGGYQQACELVIPPAPPSAAAPPPPPSLASSPAEDERRTAAAAAAAAAEEEEEEEEEEDLPLVTIAVMSGVVALCLFVCLTVTVAAFKRWKLDKNKPARSRLTKQPLYGHTHKEEPYNTGGAHNTVLHNYPCPHCALVVPSPPSSSAGCDHTPFIQSHHHHHRHHHHCDSISITVSEISYNDCSGDHVSHLLY